MSIRKFAGEDGQEPFLDWVSQKPKGYVLNTDAGLSDRGSTRLHRANCFTLEPGFGGGDRQTVAYTKVCSPDPKELNEWAVGNLGYGLRSLRCQHCEPSSLGSLTDARLADYDRSQSRSRRKCSDRICSRVLPTRSPSLKRTSSW